MFADCNKMENQDTALPESVILLPRAATELKAEMLQRDGGGDIAAATTTGSIKLELQNNDDFVVINDIYSDSENDSIFAADDDDDNSLDNDANSVPIVIDKLKLGSGEHYINVKSFKGSTIRGNYQASKHEQTVASPCHESAGRNSKDYGVICFDDPLIDEFEESPYKVEDSDEDYVYPGRVKLKHKRKKRKLFNRSNADSVAKQIGGNTYLKKTNKFDRSNNALCISSAEKYTGSSSTRGKSKNSKDIGIQCDNLDPVTDAIFDELSVLNNLFRIEVNDIIKRKKKMVAEFNLKSFYNDIGSMNVSSETVVMDVGIENDFAPGSDQYGSNDQLRILKKRRKEGNTIELVIG